MANWRPDSFIGDAFRAIAAHFPPPHGVRPPLEWGDQRRVRELLGPGAGSLSFKPREFVWRFASSDHMLDRFQRWYGPTASPSRRSTNTLRRRSHATCSPSTAGTTEPVTPSWSRHPNTSR
jgi:hypothetical protein